MIDLPDLAPVLFPQGLDVFRRVREAVLPVRCPVCRAYAWRLNEGSSGHTIVVCPCCYVPRKEGQGLLTDLRQLRSLGLVTQHPDWEDHYPDSAFEFQLVRRLRPRKGDVLKPSTIRGYAHMAKTMLEFHQEIRTAWEGEVEVPILPMHWSWSPSRRYLYSAWHPQITNPEAA